LCGLDELKRERARDRKRKRARARKCVDGYTHTHTYARESVCEKSSLAQECAVLL